MSLWDSLFQHVGQPVAQILLTRNDIADRTQFINAQNTLTELLSMGVIPIVNENDTLAVTEIKFGDNDTLSAIAAAMIHADYLFLMTDVDCLYDKNPRKFPDAIPIEVVENIDDLEADVSSAGSALGTGGMATKIVAARLGTSAGTSTIITKSSKPGNVSEIINYLHPPSSEPIPIITATHEPSLLTKPTNGDSSSTSTTKPPRPKSLVGTPSHVAPLPPLHTRFVPSPFPIRDRRFWILHGLAPHGILYIDRGAYTALARKAGLLPVGVVAVEGQFDQQTAVRLVVVDRKTMNMNAHTNNNISDEQPPTREIAAPTPTAFTSPRSSLILPPGAPSPSLPKSPALKGEEVGRALVNYSSTEIARIVGLPSSEIHNVLGYADSEYVALRENVSLNGVEKSRPVTPRMQSRIDAVSRTRDGSSDVSPEQSDVESSQILESPLRRVEIAERAL